jgi:hypothetical protein
MCGNKRELSDAVFIESSALVLVQKHPSELDFLVHYTNGYRIGHQTMAVTSGE